MNLARPLVIGTRGSPLALAQANLAIAALQQVFPGVTTEIRVISTAGDVPNLDLATVKATRAGAKGLFTKEIEAALLSGAIDLAVHSCKDLPAEMPEGLSLAAVLERAPIDDVLISKAPMPLAQQAVIGTSSVRRKWQLLQIHPGCNVIDLRGNVQTRLRKLSENASLTGILLARAGLERLGFAPSSGRLETEWGVFHTTLLPDLLPAIGQGAIALQTRREEAPHFAAVNHPPTFQQIAAERELMRLLDGGCDLPVGVRTTFLPDGALRFDAILFDPQNPKAPPKRGRVEGDPEQPLQIAKQLFEQLRGT